MTSQVSRTMGLPEIFKGYEVEHGEYACDKEHIAIQARFGRAAVTRSCISQ